MDEEHTNAPARLVVCGAHATHVPGAEAVAFVAVYVPAGHTAVPLSESVALTSSAPHVLGTSAVATRPCMHPRGTRWSVEPRAYLDRVGRLRVRIQRDGLAREGLAKICISLCP